LLQLKRYVLVLPFFLLHSVLYKNNLIQFLEFVIYFSTILLHGGVLNAKK
jgi:hypothetical protein